MHDITGCWGQLCMTLLVSSVLFFSLSSFPSLLCCLQDVLCVTIERKPSPLLFAGCSMCDDEQKENPLLCCLQDVLCVTINRKKTLSPLLFAGFSMCDDEQKENPLSSAVCRLFYV